MTSGSLDVLAEAKLAYAYHNRNHAHRISPAQLLDMITVVAAKALGMDRQVGSIESGKYADLVFVSKDNALISERDPIKSIVQYANPSMIAGVMINGAIKVWDGKLPHEREQVITKKLNKLAMRIRRQLTQ